MSAGWQYERYEARGRSLSRIWVGALWGLAEATVFFLVPDILITASALFSPRRSFLQLIAVVIGSLLGGALLYTAADKFPTETQSIVMSVPFLKPQLVDRAERQMHDRGLIALILGSFEGIPYKAYAINAPRHASFEFFLAMSLPARFVRLFLSWAIVSGLGRLFRKQITETSLAALGLLIICWIGFYTYYWSTI